MHRKSLTGQVAWVAAARVTVYCAEVNAVLARRLWPRSIVQPPLTEADRTSLALHALESQQRVELRVHVSFQDADQASVRDHSRPVP